jgi:hypothetical protein
MSKFITLIALVLLVACNNVNSSRQQHDREDQNMKPGDKINRIVKHESVKTVFDFLRWYRANYKQLSQITLVNKSAADHDSTKYYSVNFKGAEDYLSRLKGSGYISDKYIDEWRRYFQEREKNFKKNPQKDGPPDGFEFDFVLWTQEVDETLEKIENPKLIEVKESSTSSIVKVDIMMRLGFTLSKNNGKWLIDNIENLGVE